MLPPPPPTTLHGALHDLLGHAKHHDPQWVRPLRRLIRLTERANFVDAQQVWQGLLRPVRGSIHGFFICCNDLDTMRAVNIHIDQLRDCITDELDRLVVIQSCAAT